MFNRKTDKLDDILNDCLDRLAAGCEDIEVCLARYPGYASELRSLLRTAVLARKAAAVDPSPEFRARARYQLNAVLAEAGRKRRQPLAWQRNWVLAASLSLMMLLSGGGVVAASGPSMPDSPLYQVKLAVEQAQLFLTPSPSAKAELYARLADKRVTEIINMAKEGNAALVRATTGRLAADLSNITSISAANAVEWGPAPGSSSAPVTDTLQGSSETATVTKTQTTTVAGGAAISPPTATTTATTTTTTQTTQILSPPKSQSTEGERFTIDQASPGQDNFANQFSGESASNLNDLYAALEGATGDVRQALLEAIQVLVGGYDQAFNAAVEAAK